MNTKTPALLRIVQHAPTAGALFRARSNVANLKSANAELDIRLVVNAEAVAAASGRLDVHTVLATRQQP